MEDGDCLLIPILVSAPKALDLGVKCEVKYADLEGQDEQARPRTLRDAPNLPPDVALEVTRSVPSEATTTRRDTPPTPIRV